MSSVRALLPNLANGSWGADGDIGKSPSTERRSDDDYR